MNGRYIIVNAQIVIIAIQKKKSRRKWDRR
jgi:hypothetical protein